jgi:ribosome biogenesis GTPase
LSESGDHYECALRGKFRLTEKDYTNPICVGDFVEVTDLEADVPVIRSIYPRENQIVRKSNKLSRKFQVLAANLDQVMLFVGAKSPRTPLGFIDRMLINCEYDRIPAIIMLNKKDLWVDQESRQYARQIREIYESARYRVMEISLLDEEEVEQAKTLLEDRVTFIIGNSGAGKSTFINLLSPDIQQATSEVSTSYDKGMHTTSVSELFQVGESTFVADSPGIKDFGMTPLEPSELRHYVREFVDLQPACKYHNCLHLNEPKCAVKEAVDNGEIAFSRYQNYLGMLDEIR